MSDIIELKRLLRDHWSVLKDANAKVEDKQASAAAIMDIQEQIREEDKSFSSIDLRNTSYAQFLKPKKISNTTLTKATKSVITDDERIRIVQEATRLFEIKKIVADVAKEYSAEQFDNGPSVGQILEMITRKFQS